MRKSRKVAVLVSVLLAMSLAVVGCGGTGAPASGGQAKPQATGGEQAKAQSSSAPSAPAKASAPKKQAGMATGSAGGILFTLGSGMVKVINQYSTDLELTAITPPNLTQVPQMLHNNQAMLGLLPVDYADRAIAGTGEYQGNKFTKLKPVLAVYNNVFGYAVAKNSSIKSIRDVAGKRFANASKSSQTTSEGLVRAAGVDPTKVKWQILSYQEAVGALNDGNVDVILLATLPKSGLVDQLLSTKGAKWLEIDADVRKAFNKQYPFWSTVETPANTYTGQPASFHGPAYFEGLYANSDADAGIIYNVTKILLDHKDEVAAVHPAGKQMNLELTKQYIADNILKAEDFHPGATRYLKEKGIIK